MTNNPDQKTTSSPIEQALSRFDLLIDKLAEGPETDAAPPSDEPETAAVSASDAEADTDAVGTEPVVEIVELVEPEPVEPEPVALVSDLVIEPQPVAEPVLTLVPPLPAQEPTRDFSHAPVVLSITGLVRRFDSKVAVDGIDLEVRAGQIFGIVGPNGAGKTTTLSMVTGVLRPDQGEIVVNGVNVWTDSAAAKREIGILPDRLMLFDRLTGRQLLYYCGVLRGLDRKTVLTRSTDLIAAFDLGDAQDRLVTDYSAGMTRKIALAAAMIHSPRILILDEPFESVDAVSVAMVLGILRDYAKAGGTVVLSSHSMDLVESFCDSVAIVAEGRVLTVGPTAVVRGDTSLEERFITLIGEIQPGEDMEWLRSFSS